MDVAEMMPGKKVLTFKDQDELDRAVKVLKELQRLNEPSPDWTISGLTMTLTHEHPGYVDRGLTFIRRDGIRPTVQERTMSAVRNLIDELKVLAETSPVQEQMWDAPSDSYQRKRALVREMAKMPGIRKLASDLAKMAVDLVPDDATIKDREFAVGDLMMMLSSEIAVRAAVEMGGGTVAESKERVIGFIESLSDAELDAFMGAMSKALGVFESKCGKSLSDM